MPSGMDPYILMFSVTVDAFKCMTIDDFWVVKLLMSAEISKTVDGPISTLNFFPTEFTGGGSHST